MNAVNGKMFSICVINCGKKKIMLDVMNAASFRDVLNIFRITGSVAGS